MKGIGVFEGKGAEGLVYWRAGVQGIGGLEGRAAGE